MPRIPGDERSLTADAPPDTEARPDADTRMSAAGRLSDRLERLPPGHPSSPYEADGTRRQPAPRLRDLDPYPDAEWAEDDQQIDGFERYTDAEWADHRAETRILLAEANHAGLASDNQHTIDPDKQAWADGRRSVQDAIINSIYAQAKDVPNDRMAIIAGGLCGAGKTTVLSDHAEIDRSRYLTISPDDIKEESALRGLIPEVDGLSPMEASDLVHTESSYIARQLAQRAQADGKNIVWDITMSSRDSTKERIDVLRSNGYEKIDGIFVDIPIEVSIERADGRHREGEEAYRSGIGLGGRYVPPEVITSQADAEWGTKNRRAFEELKPDFSRWIRYDNAVSRRNPLLVETSSGD